MEQDVQAFENLLEGSSSNPSAADRSAGQPGPSSTSENPNVNDIESKPKVIKKEVIKPKIKSTVKKVAKDVFFVKKKFAKLAESDRDNVYNSNRRTKCLESITDLETWVNENVVNFESGKMFETLMTSDVLFDNPGLKDHDNAQDYLRAKRQPPLNATPSGGNSIEFGFKIFVRSVVKDVFKGKAKGLALRNFEVATSRGCTKEFRRKFGKFLDEIMRAAEAKETESGRSFIQLDRFQLEEVKEANASFFTNEKVGTYPIDVYTTDLIIQKDVWLIRLLEFNSFCWDTVTMMRYVARKTKAPLLEYFSPTEVNEYNDSSAKLVKILRDPTIVTPGPISLTLMTPFNTSWSWDDTYYIIRPNETWTESNVVSELVEPITIDKMLEILIDPIS